MAKPHAGPGLIARRITEARDARGLSKSELARRADLDPSYISRVESGELQEPSPGKLRQIANALNIGLNALIDPPPPSDDPILTEQARAALGPNCEHMLEDAVRAARRHPPEVRETIFEVWRNLTEHWPDGKR